MMRYYVCIFGMFFVFFGCQQTEQKAKFYFSSVNHIIAEVKDKDIVLYNIKDSLKTSYKIENKLLLINNKTIDYKLSDDSLVIYDDFNLLSGNKSIKLRRFENTFDFDLNNTFWTLNKASDSITVFFSKEHFVSYDEYDKIFDRGTYKLSNDFNKYCLFFHDSAVTFSDTFYIISSLGQNNLILTDVNTEKKYHFSKYYNLVDSLILGNWKILDSKPIFSGLSHDYLEADILEFNKKSLIFKFTKSGRVDSLNYTFGLNSKTLFVEKYSILDVVKINKDSLVLYNHHNQLPENRILKYIRVE